MKKMTIEKAKAELHAVMSGPASRHWNYGPAVSMVLAALEHAEQRIAGLEKWVRGVEESMISASDRAEAAEKRVAELESRKLVPVMYKGMELLKNDGLELIRDGLAEATELESMCMAGALLSATPAQPVAVPDERAAFNAWNNDIDCPLAGRDAKTAAWLGWSRRAAMLNQPASKGDHQ